MSDRRSQQARFRAAIGSEVTRNPPCATPERGYFADPTRRAVLVSMGGALLMAACGRREAIPPVAAEPTPATADGADFLRLSQALTGHADLDAITATRLTHGFAQVLPEIHGHFAALGALVHAGGSATELLAAATVAGLRPAALAIVAAWYTGTVGKGTGALTVSYRDALMQRPVADALTPPTYVKGGPAWWTAPPPEVGLPEHAARAATTAASGSLR